MSRANRSRDEGERVNLSALQESIRECVRFILCQEAGKIPIKRLDINKHLNNVCKTASNQMEIVITEANKVLKMVYGYKLEPVETKNNKQYIVVLNEECDFSPLPTHEDDDHRRLLIAALTHIFMSGAPVKEDDMWKFLHDADLLKIEDTVNRKILTTTFKKQMYLQYDKIPTANGPAQKGEFKWGDRAIKELPKLFLLNKVAQALEKTPDHWCEQYRDATKES